MTTGAFSQNIAKVTIIGKILSLKLGLRMRMMPRATLCQCALRMRVGHVELRRQKLVRARERLQLNRAWKVSIIYTWLVKTLHNVLSSFELSLVLFLPS